MKSPRIHVQLANREGIFAYQYRGAYVGEKSLVRMILLLCPGKSYGPGGLNIFEQMPSSRYQYEDLIAQCEIFERTDTSC